MTSYTYMQWPSFQLPSGRWIKIHMFRKFYTVGSVLANIFTGAASTMEEHPWAKGGVPEFIDEAPAGAGFLGGDGVEFRFHNIPIKPSVDDTTLFDCLSAENPEAYLWFIRVWISAGTVDTFATAANYTMWLEMATIDGDVHQEDRTWNTYIMSARNCLSVLELVPVTDWVSGYCLHATYDRTPTSISVRGQSLNQLRFGNAQPGSSDDSTQWWALPWYYGLHTTDPLLTPKMFRITDVLWSMADALGITKPINLSATGGTAGKVGMSWVFSYGNAPTVTSWTARDFDDLCIVSSMYHSNGVMDVHDQKFGFFDNENYSKSSVFNLSNTLEALRMFLVPFGLIASLQHDPADGGLYLSIREQDVNSVVLADEQEVLRGIKLDAGERAAFGFRVVDPEGVEYMEGDGDGESIDTPFVCADRMRYDARWAANTGWTEDMRAFCLGLWVCDTDASATAFYEVSRITPKRDGTERITNSVNSMYTAPHVTHNADSVAAGLRVAEAGGLVARASLAYYFNGGADPETDPVGIYRRYMKRLIWRETGLKLTAVVGAMRTILAQNWVVRKKTVRASLDETEFEAERGTYDA